MGRPELAELKLNRTGRYKHVLSTQPLQDISVVCCNYKAPSYCMAPNNHTYEVVIHRK